MGEGADLIATQVSVENQFPEDLFLAMVGFISAHPEWDQYRLMQSAVAGFLFQQGCRELTSGAGPALLTVALGA